MQKKQCRQLTETHGLASTIILIWWLTAVELVRSFQPELFFLDIQIPFMSGFNGEELKQAVHRYLDQKKEQLEFRQRSMRREQAIQLALPGHIGLRLVKPADLVRCKGNSYRGIRKAQAGSDGCVAEIVYTNKTMGTIRHVNALNSSQFLIDNQSILPMRSSRRAVTVIVPSFQT